MTWYECFFLHRRVLFTSHHQEIPIESHPIHHCATFISDALKKVFYFSISNIPQADSLFIGHYEGEVCDAAAAADDDDDDTLMMMMMVRPFGTFLSPKSPFFKAFQGSHTCHTHLGKGYWTQCWTGGKKDQNGVKYPESSFQKDCARKEVLPKSCTFPPRKYWRKACMWGLKTPGIYSLGTIHNFIFLINIIKSGFLVPPSWQRPSYA